MAAPMGRAMVAARQIHEEIRWACHGRNSTLIPPSPGAAVCLPGRVGGLLMGMDVMRGAGRHGDTPGRHERHRPRPGQGPCRGIARRGR